MKVIDIFKISFSLLERKDKIRLTLLSLFSFLGSFIEIAALTAVLPFVGLLFNSKLVEENSYLNVIWNFFNQPSYKQFILLMAILISIFLILSTALVYLIQYSSNRFAAKCQEKYGYKIFSSLLNANYEWHIKESSTLLMTIFISHLSLWNRGFLRQIPLMVSNLTFIIIPSVTLIIISPKYGISLIFLATLFISIFLKYIRQKSNFLSHKAKTSQEEVSIFTSEILQGIKDVKLSSSEKIFLKKFKSFYHIYTMYLAKASSWNQLPTSLILLSSQLLIIFIGTFLVSIGYSAENIISTMTIVVLFASKVIPSLNKIGSTISSISNKSSWIKSLNDIYLNINDKSKYIHNSNKNKKVNWDILKLDNVSYSYPGRRIKAINNIKLNIRRGMHYGFVGESGSGKSTTIDILLGLLTPNDGLVKIDEIPLEEVGVKNWQSNIGYVPQKPLITNVSLKENIAFGIDPDSIDIRRVFECVSLAALEDLVELLPNGINSKLGERGKFLSGGQEQRVAIARALYNKPSILIFDEATSFQDSKNESLLIKSISKLKGNITVISISHRFSFIRNCDSIFILENGSLKHEVSYDEFINYSDYYKNSKKFLDNN